MKTKTLAQGAEAIISLDGNVVSKNRIPKSYRLKEIDDQIRKSRTKKEAKLLGKAKSAGVDVPHLIKQEDFELQIEYIDGDKLSQKLNDYGTKKQQEVMQTLGKEVAKLHKQDIIHGDLTTSNTILVEKKVFIIDFGLGFISKRLEDKAVDLHLIKQALEAKHFQDFKFLFENFLEGYEKSYPESKKVLEQFKKVESRGRYKKSGE